MDITKIFKYSAIGLLVVLALWRVQIAYVNKIERLSNEVTGLENIKESLEDTNDELVVKVNEMEDIRLQILDEPIFGWPISPDDYSHMTSEFGYRELINPSTGGRMDGKHEGIDLAGSYHARVTAVGDGEIVEYWPVPDGYFKGDPVFGGKVVIKHNVYVDVPKIGTTYEGGPTYTYYESEPRVFYSLYGHMSITYNLSEYGSRRFVKAGQVLGRTGNTGISFGEHLHFELQDENQVAVQSLFYLRNPQISY